MQADVRNMTEIAAETVDIAFDKGTLDAMIHGSPWSPPDDVVENSRQYMNEVRAVYLLIVLFAADAHRYIGC